MDYSGKRIACSDSGGDGNPLVLLHGFTESSRIWHPFIGQLSNRFRVVTIDLPGFGQSDCLEPVHSMTLMAQVVQTVLDHLGVRKCVMTGHSMGGYVTQEFARLFPLMLNGICLFHSHPFPDTPAGKEARLKAIRVIRNDRFGFLAHFIPSLFPDEVRETFRKEIETMVQEASALPKEAILAAATGMLEREDYTPVLRELKVPVLFIIGMKDTRIPTDRLGEMLQLPEQAEALILQHVGHMGFLEAMGETLAVLRDFTDRCMHP